MICYSSLLRRMLLRALSMVLNLTEYDSHCPRMLWHLQAAPVWMDVPAADLNAFCNQRPTDLHALIPLSWICLDLCFICTSVQCLHPRCMLNQSGRVCPSAYMMLNVWGIRPYSRLCLASCLASKACACPCLCTCPGQRWGHADCMPGLWMHHRPPIITFTKSSPNVYLNLEATGQQTIRITGRKKVFNGSEKLTLKLTNGALCSARWLSWPRRHYRVLLSFWSSAVDALRGQEATPH